MSQPDTIALLGINSCLQIIETGVAIPDDFESVGAGCLGMNQPVRPDKLLEPVLPPAVDGPYLDGSDRSIESRRLEIEENDVGLNVTRSHSSISTEGSEIYFKWKFYKLSLYLLQVKTAT